MILGVLRFNAPGTGRGFSTRIFLASMLSAGFHSLRTFLADAFAALLVGRVADGSQKSKPVRLAVTRLLNRRESVEIIGEGSCPFPVSPCPARAERD